ncbi:lysozyme inhibitor LprI family protein [Ancylobacter radicis]|uniref:DUF1311 domain-containing protein n=1 Tax=Ancylobacter radicis TaxID=2836179 RepID=A0ABS5R3P6_9HYPH|nr:lysozyme inhibitor LprI family protein [Ancylobacter radicis]MBS9475865.1 DUF1311 domain-containing protein [Ancylobacter radicis]
MRGALLILAALAALPARAQEAEPTACTRGEGPPRAYLDCLSGVQNRSEARLTAAIDRTRAAIAARQDLQPAQRARWTNLFTESQERFVHWRNFECQSIAPYEGAAGEKTIGGRLGGIGVIEQRLTCLATLNDIRAANLETRYGLPAFVPPPAPVTATPPEPAPPTPAAAVPSIMAPPAPEPPADAAPPAGPVRIIGIPPTQP